jgi:RNA polymerase sigma factor (sigma-70 family)
VRSGGSADDRVQSAVQPRRIRGYHSRISAAADPARFLTDNLALLDRVVRRVAHRHRLRDDDTEELRGAVQLKLVENDYDAIRRFEGRASFETYLLAIVTRHLLDERNARWGKWRPSVYAKRLGPVAVQLEMLLTRDGVSFDEAVQRLRTRMDVTESDESLHRISLAFPMRAARRFVPIEMIEELPGGRQADDDLERSRRAEVTAKAIRALRSARQQLKDEDQLLLRMCFEQNLSLATVARVLQLEQKPLYRRREQILNVLRRALNEQGVSADDVRDVLGGDLESAVV